MLASMRLMHEFDRLYLPCEHPNLQNQRGVLSCRTDHTANILSHGRRVNEACGYIAWQSYGRSAYGTFSLEQQTLRAHVRLLPGQLLTTCTVLVECDNRENFKLTLLKLG